MLHSTLDEPNFSRIVRRPASVQVQKSLLCKSIKNAHNLEIWVDSPQKKQKEEVGCSKAKNGKL